MCLFFILLLIPFSVFGVELDLAEGAKSAVMLEVSSGDILYGKNVNERLAPASMTKIMTT